MVAVTVLLALTVVLIALIALVVDFCRKWKYLGHLPGFYCFPSTMFNILQLRTAAHEYFEDMLGCTLVFRNPRMMCFWVFNRPFIIMFGAKEVEAMLSSTKSNHIRKGTVYNFLHPWLGRGLLTNDGDQWRTRRKMLTPAFHYEILKEFVSVFNEQAKLMVVKFAQQDGKELIDVYSYVTLCALDIICETSMGTSVQAQLGYGQDFVKDIYNINEILHQRQRYPWLQIDCIFNLLPIGRKARKTIENIHTFTKKVIQERLRAREEKSEEAATTNGTANGHHHANGEANKDTLRLSKRRVFLDLLLDCFQRGEINMEQIRNEVDTMMFAGHDTTSVAIVWTLFLLGNYPEWQAKVQEEIDNLYGDSDESVTFDDLSKMPFLECCLKETLRLFPSVPEYVRSIDEDLKVGDTVIPKGSEVIIFAYGLHHDPVIWPEPYKFDPTRFFPENCVGRHPFAYVPFSAGSRNCIGQRFALMEEKIVISWILRYFRVEPLFRQDQLILTQMITLRPKKDLEQHRMRLIPRRPLSKAMKSMEHLFS